MRTKRGVTVPAMAVMVVLALLLFPIQGVRGGETAAGEDAGQKSGTFDSIKHTFSSWGKKAKKKKQEFSINRKIKKLEEELDKQYADLGSRCYEARLKGKMEGWMDQAKVKELLARIDETRRAIEKEREKLEALKRSKEKGGESEKAPEPEKKESP